MSNLTLSSYDVYTGVWTDWSYGMVMGLTLTLTQQDASLLIAFVAFFVSIVTLHIWKLACFSLHAYFSTSQRRDVLHHQRQALLRNSSDPSSTALKLVQLGWVWRMNPTLRYYKRIFPVLVFTLLWASILTISTGFSSRLARNSYEVLLRGNRCGQPKASNIISEDDLFTKNIPWEAQALSSASDYALSCYSQNTLSAELCSSMVKPQLSYAVDTDAPCPFSSYCNEKNTSIKFDSGILDSHNDLGINSPVAQRFGVRSTWHCSPLTTKGHTMIYNVSQTRSWTRYQYGAPQEITNGDYLNFTYEAPNDAYEDIRVMRPYYNVQKGSADYLIGWVN
jgi:hypothetical protein